jgi:dUTP pyrophosphatase
MERWENLIKAAKNLFLSLMNIRLINQSPFELPGYETAGSAGMDIRANIKEAVTLNSLERTLIPTGLFLELPEGFEAQLRPRSGMAYKKGITLPNSPATIDSDYRGEIMVALVNIGKEAVTIEPGDRIAQMVIARFERVSWKEVKELSDTTRGSGGFGHTGKN